MLIRPSWKEQVVGSWVHRLRYLHQWQRNALFTQERHLGGERRKGLPGWEPRAARSEPVLSQNMASRSDLVLRTAASPLLQE